MDVQIHVVRRGESLWGIGQAYGVSPQEIINANDLRDGDRLAVGQALVIPIVGSFYWVQPGESLYDIARRFGLSVADLVEVNRIRDPGVIRPGFRLYIPRRPRTSLASNAYIEPVGEPSERDDVAQVAGDLSYVAMMSYQVTRTAGLTELRDEYAREGARSGGAAPMMVITNQEQGAFSRELGETILGSDQLQNTLFDNILNVMRQKGFRVLNIDFEFIRPEDRESYNRFLRRAAERMHAAGYLLSTALAPKVSGQQVGAWYEAHDYPAHGEIADFSVIMTYEWGWSGGPPMAVAPLDQVERVIRYATSVMPPNKIMMGIPLYGYDWTLPYVQGGPYAKVVSPVQATSLAVRTGSEIEYDRTAQSPHFSYWDQAGKEHNVWFEDARSIQAKFDLVKRYGLRGVSYWKLPLEFPQNWLLLTDNFTIRKL